MSIVTTLDARGVLRVTLNNPDKHNAFDDGVIAELQAAFEQAGANPAVRALILAAEGKSFSAGADLSWMQRMANYSLADNRADADKLARMLHTLNSLPFPTIARVQGAAFGGAVGLVSCCDLAVASPRASFCLSEVKIGLIPATISPYVVAAMGERAARRYCLTAERFFADTAKQLGLVSEVVDETELDSTIDNLLKQLLANSPAALSAAKQLVFDVSNRPITQALIDDTSQRIAEIRVSDEGQEGLKAFLEKRAPRWQQES
ncbi:enoyl-CoA hydratase/isomerase family protein [Simiduia agarivorans]|uniref:Enoyl-CoA hydratase/isomerase n=1 Tax=Simiduia agarivorans (strain DSM 21679 / JCM 13881 / BCRC 17597 / SA1) TaxID=1117647 RepID=K4KLW2_SIMAS|nr:enoyl-CoA hydratase/isomerase family protein [Simiduia agarivorans]AFU99195.1 enoyl-CoA hydratase/isomerase [Simiduia agarivorans SA1 = DSM 21679]